MMWQRASPPASEAACVHKLPYTYRSRKKVSGRVKDYWRFRREPVGDCPLPGNPLHDVPAMRAYADFMERCDRMLAQDRDAHRHSFEWLAKAYLAGAEFAALSEKTQVDYQRTIDDHLIPWLGPERFDCINRAAVKTVRDHVAKDRAPRTANKVQQVASLIYSWADQEDLLPDGFRNPCENLRKLKGRARTIEIWSDEEIALFLAGAVGNESTAVMLALYTGQRREDLVRLQWSDCIGKTIRVRQNKTGEPLTIPCHPALQAHLKTIRTNFGGPVLRGQDGKPMTAGSLSALMQRAVTRIEGMPHRTLHGLRYAASGMLEKVGCSELENRSIVGHRTREMWIKYASQRRTAEAAMEKWEAGTNAG